MNRSHRSFLLASAGLALVGSVLANGDGDIQNRLQEAYQRGFRRGRAAGLEQLREMSDSRVGLARRLLEARRRYDALREELDAAREALASCGGMSIPEGEMPEDVARLPSSPVAVEGAGSGVASGPFGLPVDGSDTGADGDGDSGTGEVATAPSSHDTGHRHGPTIEIHVSPMGDTRLLEAGARGVVAGVQRDVAVVGTAGRETLGVAGTALREQGELLETGVGAVGTVAGGYVDAVRGLGEERSLLGHVGHTFTTVGGGWVQAGQDVGGQIVEGHREVWGRAWDGAQEVGSTWWDGTQHLANEVLSPFRSESD
jgi:hypothetical protein